MHRRQPSGVQEDLSTNRNETWLNNNGFFVWYILIVLAAHIVLLSLPILSTGMVWTLTNALHSLVTFLMFHWVLGTPFEAFDDGATATLTQWEQIDHGEQLTLARRILISFPIILFLITMLYSDMFMLNLFFMGLSVVPKLPSMHGVRLFGMNRFSTS